MGVAMVYQTLKKGYMKRLASKIPSCQLFIKVLTTALDQTNNQLGTTLM